MSKTVGTRTCAGCGGKAHFKELFKFPSGLERSVSGRGRHGYLHLDETCYKKAVKRNAFNFVLKRRLSQQELDEIKQNFSQQFTKFSSPSSYDSGSR